MKTRITFVGEDYWTAHLASGLNRRFPETVSCTAIRLGDNRAATLMAVWRLLRDHLIVRVGFPPPRFAYQDYDVHLYSARRGLRERVKRVVFRSLAGRALRKAVLFMRFTALWKRKFVVDWMQRNTRLLRPGRRDLMYWIGSDVLSVVRQNAAGTLGDTALRRMRELDSIAVAGHLAEELRLIGLQTHVAPFPGATLRVPVTVPEMPHLMTVVSYVPDSHRDFYGLPGLIAAARVFPDVHFRFFCGSGTGLIDLPPNVEFLGYVEDIAAVYAGSSVVVRHVEHDGDSAIVAEGLLFGRPVIYSFKVPHTIHVPYGDTPGLIAALSGLRARHHSGGIAPNTDGRAWAKDEYDVDRRFSRLLETLVER